MATSVPELAAASFLTLHWESGQAFVSARERTGHQHLLLIGAVHLSTTCRGGRVFMLSHHFIRRLLFGHDVVDETLMSLQMLRFLAGRYVVRI